MPFQQPGLEPTLVLMCIIWQAALNCCGCIAQLLTLFFWRGRSTGEASLQAELRALQAELQDRNAQVAQAHEQVASQARTHCPLPLHSSCLLGGIATQWHGASP